MQAVFRSMATAQGRASMRFGNQAGSSMSMPLLDLFSEPGGQVRRKMPTAWDRAGGIRPSWRDNCWLFRA